MTDRFKHLFWRRSCNTGNCPAITMHSCFSLESTIELKGESGLKPQLDVVDTLIMSSVECELSFSSMKGVFIPTRNSPLKTVFHRIFLKETDFLCSIFAHMNSFWFGLRRKGAMLCCSKSVAPY
jgi:hypothetical protein